VNRLAESAVRSPNSRLMIKTFDQRFNTRIVDVFAFHANDKVIGPLNLFKIMQPALHARLGTASRTTTPTCFGRPVARIS
jgi:hypothetical protein